MRPLERGRETLRHLAGAVRQRHEHGRGRRPAQQRAEQLDRRRVGPVEVVEHEHERLRRREPLEQRAHGAVAAIALVLERDLAAARERRQRREDVRELGLDVVVERREPISARGPRTYSSSASTKTENGRSRSSSDADPERTRCAALLRASGELR